jgi:hypothetical protein
MNRTKWNRFLGRANCTKIWKTNLNRLSIQRSGSFAPKDQVRLPQPSNSMLIQHDENQIMLVPVVPCVKSTDHNTRMWYYFGHNFISIRQSASWVSLNSSLILGQNIKISKWAKTNPVHTFKFKLIPDVLSDTHIIIDIKWLCHLASSLIRSLISISTFVSVRLKPFKIRS